jgi:hypothetical protein
MGNPEIANQLFHWLYDTQEQIYVQISLYRNKPDDCLRTSLCLDFDADTNQQINLWQKDLSTLIAITEPGRHWTMNLPPKKEWTHSYVLETKGYFSGERPPMRLMDRLIKVLERMDLPISIQSIFSLHWKQPKPLKKERLPDEYQNHMQAREYWRWQQKYKLAIATMPRRIIRRRIIVSTDSHLSSLLKHNIFRGLIGTNNVTATWRPLNQKERILSAISPRKGMSFTTPFLEQIPAYEMHSMLTANLSKGNRIQLPGQTFQDDIPF